jgi:acid phosphatase type 7
VTVARTLCFAFGLALLTACSSKPSAQTSGGGGGSGGAGGGLPCSAVGVSKGPWSFAIDGTTAKLRWEACRAGVMGDVVYAPEAGGAPLTAPSVETSFVTMNTYPAILAPSATPDFAGTWTMHDAALTGLAPATCYAYHLKVDPTLAGRFCTARAPGDPLTFMAIGDTNPGIGPYAAGDLHYALPKNPDFTLHGGDIQYYSSGLETWASWFPVMEPMLAHGGFFPAIGNHESEQPDEYQAYTERFFGAPGGGGQGEYYRFESAGVWFFSLDTEEALDPGSPQGGWLVEQLADATTQPGFRFSIVYFHRPLVTCGDTGDNPQLRALLEPFFLQYHVPIVIQAHMHGYERFELGNITYLTIAGGGGIIGDPSANTSRSYCGMRVSSGGVRHAAIFEVGTGTISGTIIDWQGNVFDAFTETVP